MTDEEILNVLFPLNGRTPRLDGTMPTELFQTLYRRVVALEREVERLRNERDGVTNWTL